MRGLDRQRVLDPRRVPARHGLQGYRPLLGSALLALGLAWAPAAGAQPQPPAPAATASSPAQREMARAWVLEGRALFAKKSYGPALERFQAAYQLVRVPTVGIEVARTQTALGKWAEANATAVEVMNLPRAADEPAVFGAAREQAAELLRELTARMPALRLEITPGEANAQVRLDGEEMPRSAVSMPLKVNPGPHRLRVSAPGFLPVEQDVVLAERENRALALALEVDPQAPAAAAAEAPPMQRWPDDDTAQPAAGASVAAEAASDGSGARTRGYVALGVAGVAAMVGGVTGVLALGAVPDCPNDRCSNDKRDEADTSRAYGNVATVSFGVAALAGGYGLWELLMNGSTAEAAAQRGPSHGGPGVVPLRGGALLQLSGEF